MSISLRYHTKPQEYKFESNYTSDHLDKLKKLTGAVGATVCVHTYDLVPLQAAYIATNDPFYSEIHSVVSKYGEITIVVEF